MHQQRFSEYHRKPIMDERRGKVIFGYGFVGDNIRFLLNREANNFTFSIQIQVYCRYTDFKLTNPSEWDNETSTSMFYSLLQIDIECWKPPFPSPRAQRVWVCVHANGCATGVHLWVVWRCSHEGSSGATLRWIHHGDRISTPEESNTTDVIAGFCWQPRFSVRRLSLRIVLTTQTHNYFKIIIISGDKTGCSVITYNNSGRKCCLLWWKVLIPVIPHDKSSSLWSEINPMETRSDGSLQVLRRYPELGTRGSKAD